MPAPKDRFEDSLEHLGTSKSLLINCITYQMTLDSKYAAYLDDYYGRSITIFRQDLSDPRVLKDELAPYAGILLSTISVSDESPSITNMQTKTN